MNMHRSIVVVWLLAFSALPDTLHAQQNMESVKQAEANGYSGRPERLKPGSLLGGTIAVMPGVIFHGLGHAYTHDYGAALGIFTAELLGIGMMLASRTLNESTGGSVETAVLEQALSHFGFILFMTSWAADVIGTYKGSAPFQTSRRSGNEPRIGITYRYTDNPLHRFRHHAQLNVNLEIGRFYVRPLLDLEANLERREISLDLGYRALGASEFSDHISIGLRTTRLENRPDAWAANTLIGYLDTRFDVGTILSSLRMFHVFNRLGYGTSAYQFGDRAENVPAILSQTSLTDHWLYMKSGAALSIASGTDLSVALVQDPTGIISPIQLSSAVFDTSATEVLQLELAHRYEDDAGIQVQVVMGSGFGIWLGLEYAL